MLPDRFDEILAFVDELKDNKLRWVLSDVEPLNLDIPYFDFDAKDKYLVPCKIEGPEEDLIRRRASNETVINGKLRFPNTVIVFRHACNARYGEGTFQQLKCIRYMRYYLDTLGSFDPFVESRQGFITQISVNDSMVATRLLTLLNGATAEVQDLLRGWDEVLLEVVRFLFAKPWHHTDFIKKKTSVLKQMAFAKSPIGKGNAPRWIWSDDHSILSDYQMGALEFNDADITGLPDIKEAITTAFTDLKKEGLKWLASAFETMMKSEINERAVSRLSMMVFIEAFCGFMQANEEIAHLEAIDESMELEATPTPAMATQLVGLWKEAFDDIHASEGFLTYDEWKTRVVSYMTTKSAGGDAVSFDVTVRGQTHTITARDKMLVMLSDPKKYISPELIDEALTEDNPGAIATRRVPARGIRAVFMVPLPVYVAETAFIVPVLAHQAHEDTFSINAEVGKFLADHKYGVKASNEANSLILLMDFSGFDTTEKWNNVRQYMVKAAVEWGAENGLLDVPFGPWKSIIHLIVQVWNKYRNPVFAINDVKRVIDQVVSGEFGTIVNNNFVNLANFRVALDRLWEREYQLMSKMRLEVSRIQGDDSMSIFDKASGWSASEIDSVRQVFGDTAKDNSLVLNLVKTGIRRAYYEYLKKMAVHGWIIGRLSALMIWCAERNSFSEEVVTMMKSYWGLLSEYVSRGGDHDFINLVGLFTWNLKRRVKYPVGRSNAFYTLPFGAIWCPAVIDAIPWTMIGASKGPIMNQMYFGAFRDYINFCWYVTDVPSGVHKGIIVDEVMNGDTFTKGVKFMKENLDPNVSRQSNIARQALHKIGIDIARWAYDKSPERLVRRSVQDNPKLGTLLRDVKKTAVGLMSLKEKRLRDGTIKPTNGEIYLAINEGYEWFERYCMYARGYTFERTESPELHARWTNLTGKSFIQVHTTRPPRPVVVVISKSRFSLEDLYEEDDVIVMPDDIWEMPRLDFTALISRRWKHGNLIKDYWYSEYKWQEPLHFMYGEPVPLLHPDHVPIAGMSPIIREKLKATGVSSAGDENSIKLTKLAAAMIKTRSLPNDITSDILIDIVTHPSIIKDPQRVISVLVAMGADSEAASKFAIDIHTIASKFLMVSTIKTFSTSDQIIGNMDLRHTSYERIVDVGPLSSVSLESYIKAAAVLHSLVDKNMQMRKTRVWVQGNKLSSLQKEILGELYDPLNELIEPYPSAPM
jgi:hypothetical protein